MTESALFAYVAVWLALGFLIGIILCAVIDIFDGPEWLFATGLLIMGIGGVGMILSIIQSYILTGAS